MSNRTVPDWQLPAGVDRGLWDYLHSAEMVNGYDRQIDQSALATADLRFCERHFPTPGRLIDLGCGTGRLARQLVPLGFSYIGVDLSEEMLATARAHWRDSQFADRVEFVQGNIVDLADIDDNSFDYAACLFSTLGMLRGHSHRQTSLSSAYRVLKPGGLLILHAHNRWFAGLGFKRLVQEFARTISFRPTAGDWTMPQAYGGAELTLHHFRRQELKLLTRSANFELIDCQAVSAEGTLLSPQTIFQYGFMMALRKPELAQNGNSQKNSSASQ